MLCSPRSFAKITTQIAAHCTSRCNNVCNTLQLSKSFCMLDSICVFHLDHSSTAFDEWRCDANQVGCNTPHHTLQHTTTHYNTLQHTAAHCNTLQHTAGTVSDVRHCGNFCDSKTGLCTFISGGFLTIALLYCSWILFVCRRGVWWRGTSEILRWYGWIRHWVVETCCWGRVS